MKFREPKICRNLKMKRKRGVEVEVEKMKSIPQLT
jgi:hypothetical protein